MIGEFVAYGLISVVILLGALWSVMAHRTFHAALGLGVALVGIAALFVLMGSPFLGAIQILVYVGGILTLMVFAIMFVAGDEEDRDLSEVRQ